MHAIIMPCDNYRSIAAYDTVMSHEGQKKGENTQGGGGLGTIELPKGMFR